MTTFMTTLLQPIAVNGVNSLLKKVVTSIKKTARKPYFKRFSEIGVTRFEVVNQELRKYSKERRFGHPAMIDINQNLNQ